LKNQNYPLYEVEQLNSFKELINFVAEKHGDNPAFTFERNGGVKSVSYRQFKSDVASLGTAFYKMGLSGKAAVIGENSYEWIATYFAVTNSGNVIVPLDKELPIADLKYIIDNSGAEMLVYSDSFSDLAAYLQENGSNVKYYVNKNQIPELIKQGETAIKNGNTAIANLEVDNKAMSTILYTSGTTGMAKGVMLTPYAIMRDTVAAANLARTKGSHLLVLPLHHSFGFTGCCVFPLLVGGEIVINSGLKNILSDLEKFKPYNMFLVPLFIEKFYKRIWDAAKKKGKDGTLRKLIGISNGMLKVGIDARRVLFKSVLKAFGGNLEIIVSGGAPVDNKYVQGLRDFGILAINGYGITECSPVVAVNRNNYYRADSAGQVVPACEVKILDPNETGHGEICVKGDIVMLGYYNNEQATKDAFDGEWFKTGDIGYMDDDGFLFITGRKKNLIILGNGKNVYPEELEFNILNNIPYVSEVVVYADGSAIVAEVFLDTENDPDCASRLYNDVIALNKKLASYQNINRTIVRDTEFPKTTTKKIKRQYKNGTTTNA